MLKHTNTHTTIIIMEYIVLGVQSWEIEDEKTRKKLDGISVHYIDPLDRYDDEESSGILPAKLTAKTSLRSSFTNLPGKYKFDIGLKRTGGGRSGAELISAKYIGGPINLTDSSTKSNYQTDAAKAGTEAAKEAAKEVSKVKF